MGHLRAALVAVAASLGVALALTGGGPASAQGTCAQFDVAGTWQTHQSNNYDTTFVFSQSETTLSGTATLPGDQMQRAGFSGAGSVSGTMSGTSLTVTVTWPKADGGSVSGTYSATVEQTTSTQGKLSGGTAGPTDWTGSGPARCVRFVAEPATLGEQSIAVPQPGKSVTATSPKTLSSTARKLDTAVTSSSASLSDTTLVAAAAERRTKVGEAVAACWLIGPDALNIPTTFESPEKTAKIVNYILGLNAERRFIACLAFVRLLNRGPTSGTTRATAASCRATRLQFTAKRSRSGRLTNVRIRRRTAGKRDLRYSCTTTSAGGVRITADGRRKGGLRSGIGNKLRFGALRTPDAPPDSGRLTFRFGV